MGTKLTDHGIICFLRRTISKLKRSISVSIVKPFVAIIAPSGSGKAQPPFSLKNESFPSIHLVFTFGQPVYRKLKSISEEFVKALKYDLNLLNFKDEDLDVAALLSNRSKLRAAAGVLYFLGDENPIECSVPDLVERVNLIACNSRPVFFLDEAIPTESLTINKNILRCA